MSNPAEGNPGINALARALQGQMRRNLDANASLPLDFGTIQEDYSLRTNTFPIPIPKSDYTVCRHLVIGQAGDKFAKTAQGDGAHDHKESGEHGGHSNGFTGAHSHENEGDHVHDILLPETMRKLLPGDTVLVAWVQDDPVVIDIVLPASKL